ncbi:MAG: NADH dehydrogenase subunit, partial [Bdellovibrionaceae bacterium]|nr:NADH dehydrogenase subunit [Pseudobdellovibrionaceae bacterium]
AGVGAKNAAAQLKSAKADEIALVLTGQNTVEEYDALLNTFVNTLKTKNVYHWWPQEAQAHEFDGILLRGDKNPNTKGLQEAFASYGINTKWAELEASLKSGKIKHLVVVGPENLKGYTGIDASIDLFSQAANLIYATSVKILSLKENKSLKAATVIPMKSYIEKEGTFVNYAGLAQKFKKATIVVNEALTGIELAQLLAGENPRIQTVSDKNLFTAVSNTRIDQVTLDQRKKNEFNYSKGRL